MEKKFYAIILVLIGLMVFLSGCNMPPQCGNNVCESKETPENCPYDCANTGELAVKVVDGNGDALSGALVSVSANANDVPNDKCVYTFSTSNPSMTTGDSGIVTFTLEAGIKYTITVRMDGYRDGNYICPWVYKNQSTTETISLTKLPPKPACTGAPGTTELYVGGPSARIVGATGFPRDLGLTVDAFLIDSTAQDFLYNIARLMLLGGNKMDIQSFKVGSPVIFRDSTGKVVNASDINYLSNCWKNDVPYAVVKITSPATASTTTVIFKKGQNVATNTTATSYGAIQYVDINGEMHSVPMAIYLNATSAMGSGSTFKFDGIDHAYATNNATSPVMFRIKSNSTDVNLLKAYDYTRILILSESAPNTLLLTGKNLKKYTYRPTRGVNNGVWLTLVGLGTKIDDLQYNAGSLFFLGTSLNDANITTNINDYNFGGPKSSLAKPYYYPDVYDFNGVQTGSSTGVYRTAIFEFTENTKSAWQPAGTNSTGLVYIDSEGGNAGTVDTANVNKLNYTGKTTAVEYFNTAGNLNTFCEPPRANCYTNKTTANGTIINLNNRQLTMTFVK